MSGMFDPDPWFCATCGEPLHGGPVTITYRPELRFDHDRCVQNDDKNRAVR